MNDYNSACGGSSPDKVFYLDEPVPDGQSISFWTSGDDYDVVLYGRYESCTGTEIACVDDPDGTIVSWENTTGTDKYIWFVADGFGSSNGTATLNWEIIPLQLDGDDCTDPVTITGTPGTEPYNTTGFTNDYSGNCGGSGAEKVYSLTTPVPDGYMIDIWVNSSDYDVIFYAHSGSCGGDEIGCINDVDDTQLNWKNTSGSDAYIWIVADGDGGGEGAADLNWEIKVNPLDVPDNLTGYIEVYPNPVSEVLHIDVKHTGLIMENIVLYDSQGKIILQENNENQSTSQLELNLSDLSEGFYMLEILTNKGLFTERLLIK